MFVKSRSIPREIYLRLELLELKLFVYQERERAEKIGEHGALVAFYEAHGEKLGRINELKAELENLRSK